MTFYDEMQELARELIDGDCFNEEKIVVQYFSRGATVDTDKPWRETKLEATGIEIPMIFLPDEFEDRQFSMFRRNSLISSVRGEVNALVAHKAGFVPKLDDYIIRPETDVTPAETLTVVHWNPITPTVKTVLHYLEFNR